MSFIEIPGFLDSPGKSSQTRPNWSMLTGWAEQRLLLKGGAWSQFPRSTIGPIHHLAPVDTCNDKPTSTVTLPFCLEVKKKLSKVKVK